ncbi:hypothetical protein Y032_0030g2015 [Ancylostoma ceylanicum]|uniref:Uncharacterized protein n=1 Tax=Ancylostoma ceylanicum TaxID=53326 RepID=A0A016UR42_9BILA|nr:hypothetical protein Y032_0030g2015 [Ancylostoma ceylanicum]
MNLNLESVRVRRGCVTAYVLTASRQRKDYGEHGTPSKPSWGLGYSSQDVIDPDIDLSIDFIGFLILAPIQIEKNMPTGAIHHADRASDNYFERHVH